MRQLVQSVGTRKPRANMRGPREGAVRAELQTDFWKYCPKHGTDFYFCPMILMICQTPTRRLANLMDYAASRWDA